MTKEIELLSKEIDGLMDRFVPYGILTSMPIDGTLLYYINIHGVYIFYSGKRIIYIGNSVNIGSRLKVHLKSIFGNKITSMKIIRFPSRVNSIRVEADLIEEFKPAYNKTNSSLYGFSLPPYFDLENTIKELKDSIK